MSLPEASKIISTMWNAMGDDVKTVRSSVMYLVVSLLQFCMYSSGACLLIFTSLFVYCLYKKHMVPPTLVPPILECYTHVRVHL